MHTTLIHPAGIYIPKIRAKRLWIRRWVAVVQIAAYLAGAGAADREKHLPAEFLAGLDFGAEEGAV
jgi:hypothetical protein